MKLELDPYWDNIVTYYYSNNIQTRKRKNTSIWDWLEEDFGADRGLPLWGKNIHCLKFNNEADATAFKLRFI
jgi:hypothetical protein